MSEVAPALSLDGTRPHRTEYPPGCDEMLLRTFITKQGRRTQDPEAPKQKQGEVLEGIYTGVEAATIRKNTRPKNPVGKFTYKCLSTFQAGSEENAEVQTEFENTGGLPGDL